MWYVVADGLAHGDGIVLRWQLVVPFGLTCGVPDTPTKRGSPGGLLALG